MRAGLHIQVAMNSRELPAHIAKQLGTMWLKRYRPNPAVRMLREYKAGTRQGALCWALDEAGKVHGWAMRAKAEGATSTEVALFVRAASRRQGIGDAMLDVVKRFNPAGAISWFPHDSTAKAFFAHRTQKMHGRSRLP